MTYWGSCSVVTFRMNLLCAWKIDLSTNHEIVMKMVVFTICLMVMIMMSQYHLQKSVICNLIGLIKVQCEVTEHDPWLFRPLSDLSALCFIVEIRILMRLSLASDSLHYLLALKWQIIVLYIYQHQWQTFIF